MEAKMFTYDRRILGAFAAVTLLAAGCAADMGETGQVSEETSASQAAHVFWQETPEEGAGEELARDVERVESKVLNRFVVPRVGTVSLIDEDPSSEVPQIGVLVVSSSTDDKLLPLVHEDGTEITPVEYLLSADASADVSPRLLEQHVLATGGTQMLSVVYDAGPEVTAGNCAAASWQSYFDNQALSFGGVGAPAHVLNTTTSLPSWTASGNLGKYSRIVAGACFVSQGDGNDNLTVKMERRVDGTWQTVSGTQATLNTTINGGKDRYLYKSGAYCYDYERRITVSGLPPGGIYAPDKFHLSGAWGGHANGCWISSGG
ncbi:hypothetical protein [Polyangium spumosum]|uniref:Uncharacterized protein n=1 Tax=Polyangium spumosum TaxID=889282 RepID=A0A6N7PV23_9BACT|nr:hypothetical protein [Polyangium spumosum]MRG94656.1 hypothetical protein [Polyangium spumosum]